MNQAGELTQQQAELLFAHMPVSFCLADEADVVRFWAGAAFTDCSPELIGLDLYASHPAQAHAGVRSLLSELKSGVKDQVDQVEHGSNGAQRIIHTALRDGAGVYRGVLETVFPIEEPLA
ncbi:MAG: PAS domain-containing protein [Acidimicrobiales bacterium]|jgi:DUF438 domain-containing protein